MDKKYLLAGIVLVVIVAGFFLFTQQTEPETPETFSAGFLELKQVWANFGVDISSEFIAGTNTVLNSSDSDFTSLKVNLLNFKSVTKSNSLKDLADIHVSLIDTLIEVEKTDSQYAHLSAIEGSFDAMCPLKADFQNFVSSQEEIIASYTNLSGEIQSFESNYPEEASEAFLQYLRPNNTKMNETINNEKELLQTMEYFCYEYD